MPKSTKSVRIKKKNSEADTSNKKGTHKNIPKNCREENPQFPSQLLQKPKQYNHKPIGELEILVPSAVFLARNFLSESECKAWIKHAEEEIGFERLDSPQTREYAQRECGRIQQNDWTMSAALFERMKPIVLKIANQVVVSNFDPSYAPVACNGNIRIYKYERNMSFGRHYDGSNRIDRFLGGNTEITVLIYLSSCGGGATRFHLPHASSSATKGRKRKSKGTGGGTDNQEVAFVPAAGAILLHMHGDRCLEHEADPVLEGVKYILRTDIVYATASSVM